MDNSEIRRAVREELEAADARHNAALSKFIGQGISGILIFLLVMFLVILAIDVYYKGKW